MKHFRMTNGSSLSSVTEGAFPAIMLCYIYIDWGNCGPVDECGLDFGSCVRRDVCLVDY